tara:strand:+ start:160 stop:345 length:186 start_codon:yes stop_codon:yes gene_type:complete
MLLNSFKVIAPSWPIVVPIHWNSSREITGSSFIIFKKRDLSDERGPEHGKVVNEYDETCDN